ncbi:uncharacterized protein K452DRAFT_289088 [Aplosporella prunicola CBS 121167]|uniref:Uncharacterized protein n=1 Tax=Aplosporella prunicola CBS 121167 TaxID=1176127 RepID=A0A6A6BAQ0_9PEZI|nr:uncharacterized protein K452DRAFT_289088 [Aplosporella prunicola CBS 121167]KAF2140345.1 hypothetical protein K452DRAFT_289088 [Aplosporella prunicola CBS 121167]
MNPTEPAPYTPTADAVHVVRTLFVQGLGLPVELADLIIEAAGYYPTVFNARSESATDGMDVSTRWSRRSTVAFLYLISDPIPRAREGELVKIKSVKFHTTSRDQGWASQGSYGTYNGSSSWFETSIFRPVPGAPDELDLDQNRHRCMQSFFHEPEDAAPHLQTAGWNFVEHDGKHLWKVQYNIVAGQYFVEHDVEWRPNEEPAEEVPGKGDGKGFIGALEPGDRVGLWARALYPGWSNRIRDARMEIAYSV